MRCYDSGVLYVGPNYPTEEPTEDSIEFPVCDTWDTSGKGYSTRTVSFGNLTALKTLAFPFKINFQPLCDASELGPYQNGVLKEKKLHDGTSQFYCPKNICYRFCDHKYADELTDLNNCDLTWDKKKLNDCRKENKL